MTLLAVWSWTWSSQLSRTVCLLKFWRDKDLFPLWKPTCPKPYLSKLFHDQVITKCALMQSSTLFFYTCKNNDSPCLSLFHFYCLTSSYECSNPIYGETVNPHNLQKTPGGSSGGEGALIGGGGSLLGLGSDIGGSIRIPASFCGICGFKPTAGRLRWVFLFI